LTIADADADAITISITVPGIAISVVDAGRCLDRHPCRRWQMNSFVSPSFPNSQVLTSVTRGIIKQNKFISIF
jgi:hypothetical protein